MSSLAYIHIKKWMGNDIKMENISLNFDSNYNFNYTDGKLIIEDISKSNNFKFKIDNKSKCNIDINTLIGKNGAGKSTVLDFIREIFCGSKVLRYLDKDEKYRTTADEVCIVIKNSKKKYEVFGAKKPLNEEQERNDFIYTEKAYGYSKEWHDNNIFENTDFIYMSNCLGYRDAKLRIAEKEKLIHDISTTYYLQKDNQISRQGLYGIESNFMGMYESMNTERIFKYLTKYPIQEEVSLLKLGCVLNDG